MPPVSALRIIVLDDYDAIRTALLQLLTDQGYEVYAYSHPGICPLRIVPECRCRADQACTDVIISDLDMPTMTGLRFIETQKTKSCKCRHVALMSGSWSPEDLRRAKQLGCKTFAKPFRLDDLLGWLEDVRTHIDPQRQLCNWVQESVPDIEPVETH
jgi:CheY-like chemotaxis protein